MSHSLRTIGAGAAALSLGLAGTAGASTSDTTPRVVNREVVQAELHSDGGLDVARLFSQLSVVGQGTVLVADPVSGKGLRNLDGFGSPKVRDGNALYTIKVDGTTSRRTVSDFTKALPVEVSASYTLGGKPVKAKDIVGKTGDVTATYKVTNVSGTPTDITWKDGKGVSHTETVDLVTPLVGQVRTTLPGSYSDLVTPPADVAADGRGGTILTYSMVLFEPIGEATQSFTWSGHVKDGQVPPVTIELVPVSPSAKPELNTGVVGYRDGAAQAAELTAGAGLIDANLLKLQGGAGDLLAGLTKLAAGAADLRDGLTADAVPGAKKLAAGLDTAKAGITSKEDGLPALSDGANQVADGAAELSAGTDQLDAGGASLAAGVVQADDGASQLTAGLQQITGGLDQLAAVDGLPAAKAGAVALRAGVTLLLAGLGDAATSGTILNGLAQASGGVAALETAGAQLKGGVDAVNSGLATAKTALQGLQAAVGGSAAEISGALATLGCPGSLNPVCPLLDSALNSSHGLSSVTLPGLASLESGTTSAITALGQVSAGLAASNTGLAQVGGGLTLVTGGVNQIKAGLSHPTGAGGASDPGGVAQGLDALVLGLSDAVDGVTLLDAGAHQATTGAATLSGGLGQLAAGADQLSAGLGDAAAGASDLADGAGQVADGADQAATDLTDGITQLADGGHQLADGLGAAADGSSQLADGLDQAKAGDKQVVDGAGRLRSEGTSKLVKGGNDTAGENAKKYQTLVALESKVADGGLPYGAPEGATGSAAYQLTLAAANTAAHDNVTRGAAALVLLLAASAVSWLLRRRFAAR